MNIQRYKYYILPILVMIVTTAVGQQKKLLKAEYEFEQKNYTKAEKLFSKALLSAGIDEKPDLLMKIAECNENMNQYEKAIEYYEQYVILSKNPAYDPVFHLGTLYLKTAQITKAKAQFENLLLQKPDNKELGRMLASCDFARNELQKTDLPAIINQEAINSEQSEFGLAWLNDYLVFASKRLGNDFSSIHGRTNQGFSNMYMATLDPMYNLYSNPVELKGEANSQYNDGTFAFDKNTNTAYFTQCKKVPERCQIYKGKYENEEIIDVSVLSFSNKENNFAHPSISADGQTLYFVSDMPGGFGGEDIWKANITSSGSLENIQNLGDKINTEKDEMFPYIYKNNILFFSSEGHVGMGGLDIFYSEIDQGVFSKPTNLGAPINSTSDDFSILLHQDGVGGMFCSNRENEEKSDDIFSFSHNLFSSNLTGTVNDSLKLMPVSQAKISYKTNSETEQIVSSDSQGKFILPMASHPNCGATHKIVVEKSGYRTKTIDVACNYEDELIVLLSGGLHNNTLIGTVRDRNTDKPLDKALLVVTSVKGFQDTVYSTPEGIWRSENISPNDYYNVRASKSGYLSESKNILLSEEIAPGIISANNGIDTDFKLYPIELKKEFRIDNIYYEFDKSTLTDDSKIELGNLVNILTENPSITIQVNSHTDARGSDSYNQRLSDERGKSVVTFLIHQGIANDRLFSKGFGESALVVKNAKTDEEHQLNRRTTFEILGTAYNAEIINEGLEKEKVLADKYKNQNTSVSNHLKIDKPQSTKITGKYGVQVHATSKPVDVDIEMKQIADLIEKYGLKTVRINNMYKYQLGPVGDRDDANQLKKVLGERGYGDCFLIVMEQ